MSKDKTDPRGGLHGRGIEGRPGSHCNGLWNTEGRRIYGRGKSWKCRELVGVDPDLEGFP